jgi:hypothetical protein
MDDQGTKIREQGMRVGQGGEYGGQKLGFREAHLKSCEGGDETEGLEHVGFVLVIMQMQRDVQKQFLERRC